MNRLYQKNELLFSLVWIFFYILGNSVANELSMLIGIPHFITSLTNIALCIIAFRFIKYNGLSSKYGLNINSVSKDYIPLVIISSCNLWFGLNFNLPLYQIIIFTVSMICVGFIEEIVFRGFLFTAMKKDGIKSAIIVSSVTFGIGHIINLFTGNPLIPTLCQIMCATAFGFMFVIIFYKRKTLIPCILSHSAINAFSVISNYDNTSQNIQIIFSISLTMAIIIYTVYLNKQTKKAD